MRITTKRKGSGWEVFRDGDPIGLVARCKLLGGWSWETAGPVQIRGYYAADRAEAIAALAAKAPLHGVFAWRKEGLYPASEALSTHTTRAAASVAIDALEGHLPLEQQTLVIRWVYPG